MVSSERICTDHEERWQSLVHRTSCGNGLNCDPSCGCDCHATICGWCGEYLRLRPIVDRIGDVLIRHGERGFDLDPEHPEACLCGYNGNAWSSYLLCPERLYGEGGIESLIVSCDDHGRINVERP